MDVWEQAEIDKLPVETLARTRNDRCWSAANSSANASLAIPMTVYRGGAAKREVSLYAYISKSAGKPTDKFMIPACR